MLVVKAFAPGTVLVFVGSWFCGRYAAPMSTALRFTVPPPWNVPIRSYPWLPTYAIVSAVDQGIAIWISEFHWTDAGTFALYWKVTSAGTGCGLRPVPLPTFWSCPLSRFVDVEIGGLPGIEKTVLPSGRS